LQFDAPTIADHNHATTGAITIRGAGHQQRFFSADSPESLAILDALVTDDPSIDRDLLLRLGATIDIVSDTAGITANNTHPIALVGRDLKLAGGQIDTPGGAIDLVAIASGSVAIDPSRHTQLGEIYATSDAIILGDILLSEAATLNTSGVGSGTVRLRGHNLVFDDGSVIFSRPLGGDSGGRISLEASGDITFQGISSIDGQGSGIIGGTLGRGRGSEISMSADNVTIRDGGFLSSTTFASGSGGDTTIAARDQFEIIGTNGDTSLSVIFADSAGTGTAGNITLAANQVRVADGAQLTARSQRTGRGGNIRIEATDHVELSGFVNRGGAPFVANISRDSFPSGLFVLVDKDAAGDGGSIEITARSLDILGGAQLLAYTDGSGNAGNVTLRTTDNVSVVGTSPNGLTRSNISAIIRPLASGNGGQLTIETSRLDVLNTAFISVTSFGNGRGGSLNVTADNVTIRGASATNELIFGGIFAEVRSPDRISALGLTGEATGDGGNVTVNARDRIQILNGGHISVLTDTTGNAGDLTVRAAEIEVAGVVEIPTASPNNQPFNRATISAGAEELGRGGTLLVETDRLIVRDGGRITVGTEGSGNAGDLTVIARESAFIEGSRTVTTNGLTQLPSTISASSENTAIGPASGNAGSLNLTVGDLTVRDGGQISVSSDNQGSTGDLQIQAETIAVLDAGRITAESVIGDRGNIRITGDTVQLRRNGHIDANAIREATGGNVSIEAETIATLEASNISANAIVGSGGQIRIQTSGLFLAADSAIEASSQFGIDGIVEIEIPDVQNAAGIVDLNADPFDPDRLIAEACSATMRGGRFTNVGRDGFPENTVSAQRETFEIVTPQGLTSFPQAIGYHNPDPQTSQDQATIIEAEGWQRNASGETVLAASSSYARLNSNHGCHEFFGRIKP
jgi:large exoprotein involved in heme utilization and adhesion